MIKNLISLSMIISICLFIFFVITEYLSDKNKKLINLNRLNIDQGINEESMNLPILKSDTDNVIEFNEGYNQKNNTKPQRKFWKLFKNKSEEIKLINIYVPNGNPIETEKYEYKKIWFKSFINEVKNKLLKNKNIIIGGDFNVIPEEIDVYNFKKYENDALFKLEIRKKFRELLNLGFQDIYRFLNKEKTDYTFWDYMAGSWQKNYGMRIDHFLVSSSLLSKIKAVNIDKKPRGKVKPSDHTPIEIEIN